MPYGQPDILIAAPYKECVGAFGMRQEGKTNLLKYLLDLTECNYTVFDTLGQVSKGFTPRLENQKIIKPTWTNMRSLFEATASEVWKCGNQIFVIDEISVKENDDSGHGKPYFCDKWWINPWLNRLSNQGGNRNIGLWITSQRVAQVHNDLLGNCRYHFIFRLYLPQDLEWYSKVVPKEVIMLAKDLPKYHFIYYQLGQSPQVFRPVKKMG